MTKLFFTMLQHGNSGLLR